MSKFLAQKIVLLAVLFAGTARADEKIQAYFSPGGGVSTAIASAIADANTSVLVSIYALSDKRITDAIIDRYRHGVAVKVIVDRRQEAAFYSTADDLFRAAVPLHADYSVALSHDKYAVIDADTVVTGSANWSVAGNSKNAENVVIIRDENLAAIFERAHAEAWARSQPFVRRSSRRTRPTTTKIPRRQPPTER